LVSGRTLVEIIDQGGGASRQGTASVNVSVNAVCGWGVDGYVLGITAFATLEYPLSWPSAFTSAVT
jgi:hypothetical protein